MIISDIQDEKIKAKLAELGTDDDERGAKFLADKTGLPYIDLRIKSPEMDAMMKIPENDAEKFEIVAFKFASNQLHIALLDPSNEASVNYLRGLATRYGKPVVYIASRTSIRTVLKRYDDLKSENVSTKGLVNLETNHMNELIAGAESIKDYQKILEDTVTNEKKERISKLIELTMAGAIKFDASDIHTEPEAELVRVRFRLDGNLNDIYFVDKPTYNMMISRLKLLSGLKLSNTSIAQDGRFSISRGKESVEVRVSVVPGSNGESFVMRLLDPKNANVPFESLGMNETMMRELERAIRKPFGMVLTTGPTGSGKSTTLYSCLRKIYTPEVKVITIEDPVEYHFDGITQTQVDIKKGYTFLGGLRAALRQDPDVIMVGEIRDEDTAKVAAQAALTGHIVLSTLHTNSAAGAIPRFIDLGVDAKTLGSSLSLVMAQRLCRKLCPVCRVEVKADAKQSKLITNILGDMIASSKSTYNFTPQEIYTIYNANPEGCNKCHFGYKGRVGVFEAIVMNKKIEDIAVSSGGERDIRDASRDQGIPDMREDGIIKILQGVTDFQELEEVVEVYI